MSAPSRSVLVVDDEPAMQELIGGYLKAEGFAVDRALTAAHAIEQLRAAPYDGVVVDLRLGEDNGMDVLDEALARHPGIRAVVITAFGGVTEALEAITRGAIDFLIKPFQLTQLSRGLRAAIDQRELREENEALRRELQRLASQSPRTPGAAIPEEGLNFVSVVTDLERDLILRSLEKTGGNKMRAARLLKMSRTTLIDKLHRLKGDAATA